MAQADAPEVMKAPETAVSSGFIVAYAIVQIAIFVAFAPLLSILIPLKVQALHLGDKTVVLSTTLVSGAVAASLANIVFGALSDRTTGPFGRRSPWLFGGALGVVASYGVIHGATSEVWLLSGVVMFQVFLNMIFAPLNAVFADRVPDRQKGAVSGWLSLRSPLGTAIGAAIIGGALRGEGARFIALALVVLCTAPPFALILRDRPTPPRTAPPRLGPPRLVPSQAWRPPSRGFVLFWVTRFLVQFSMACATGYLLYYLEDLFGPGVRARAEERVALLAVLSTIAGAATGPLSGFATSRLQGRLRMALAGAAVIALGLGLLAAHLGWIAALIAAGLLGAGYGCYAAMDTAIAAQVLPSLDHAGRDLGLLNLANTLPQVAAPLAAWLIFSLTKGHLGFTALYMIAGGASLVGGLAAQGIRAPRPRRRQII